MAAGGGDRRLEVCTGALIHAGHPLPHRLTVPFFLALLLLFSGASLLTMAIRLRRLPVGASVTSLPLYASRSWAFMRSCRWPWGIGALLGPAIGDVAMHVSRHGLPFAAAIACTMLALFMIGSRANAERASH
ncbi:hypothetical protein [Amorphus sp. MBR-141]